MKDQRGPAIHALTGAGGARRHWRREHDEPDEAQGVWYFEAVLDGEEWWCVRQVAPHPAGVSAYDWRHLEDEHGFLADQPIAPDEPLLEAISAEEFEVAWREAVRRR